MEGMSHPADLNVGRLQPAVLHVVRCRGSERGRSCAQSDQISFGKASASALHAAGDERLSRWRDCVAGDVCVVVVDCVSETLCAQRAAESTDLCKIERTVRIDAQRKRIRYRPIARKVGLENFARSGGDAERRKSRERRPEMHDRSQPEPQWQIRIATDVELMGT